MPNFKNNRLSEDIMRELSGLIRERVKDPRVSSSMISIVRVDLSGDNSHCKVFVSSFDGLDAAKTAVKGLDSAQGMLRREISNKLHLKKCPEFRFIADDSIEKSAELLRKLKDTVHEEEIEEVSEEE